MNAKNTRRNTLILVIILFYLFPIAFFSGYCLIAMPRSQSWMIGFLGLFVCTAGSALLYFFVQAREHKLTTTISQASLLSTEAQDIFQQTPFPHFHSNDNESKVEHLSSTLEEEQRQIIADLENSLKKSEEQRNLDAQEVEHCLFRLKEAQEENKNIISERDKLQKLSFKLSQELSEYKIFSQEQLGQKTTVIQNLHNTVENLKADLESKQEKLTQFETKVRDLSYEIKTLLQLNESESLSPSHSKPNPPSSHVLVKENIHHYQTDFKNIEEDSSYTYDKQVRTPAEASLFLKRCVEIAQKFNGANYYPADLNRNRDLPQHNYAIDLRRLFDSLRSENASVVLVYSPKEDRLLFVNNQSKNVFGWNSEKFVQDFASIIQPAQRDWKEAITQIQTQSETYTRMLIKTKTGHDLIVQCMLGIIPTGLFKGYIVGVLYPSPDQT